jgi:hypothetical protein
MTRLTIKQSELPFLLAAIILLALIYNCYLDNYPWIIWLTIMIIPHMDHPRKKPEKTRTRLPTPIESDTKTYRITLNQTISDTNTYRIDAA